MKRSVSSRLPDHRPSSGRHQASSAEGRPACTRVTQRTGIALLVAATTLAASACSVAPRPRVGAYHLSDAPVSVTRIVHGSYLVDFAGVRLLVDPWFYPRGMVNQNEPLGLTFRTLPPIAGILITNRHQDHLDTRALETLRDRDVPVIVPPGAGNTVADLGYTDVRELSWWMATRIGEVALRAVPSDHGTRANGYVMTRDDVTVYAAGDTRYFDGIREIADRMPPLDVALLPIGGMRFFGRLTEMRPEDAARAVQALDPERVVPVRYGMTGPWPIYWSARHPVEDFRAALQALGLDEERLVVIEPGESWHYYGK
jgi:N-acyl-phosphatidylethanolamine-hydrolysing phospholipase D